MRKTIPAEVNREDRIGYFYEAILSLALDIAVPPIAHQAHVMLANVNVFSDIVIPSINDPQYVILATHSEAESGTNMKFWRNINEILEIREHAPDCRLINVIFPSSWKADMLPVMGAISEVQIIFPTEIAKSIKILAKTGASGPPKSLANYKTMLIADGSASKVLKYLSLELRRALKSAKGQRWKQYAITPFSYTKLQYKSDSHMKKGLIKLALLTPEDRKVIIESGGNTLKLEDAIFSRIERVGAAEIRKGIVNRRILKPEIKEVLQALSPELMLDVYAKVSAYHGDDQEELLIPLQGYGKFNLQSFSSMLCQISHAAKLANAISDLLIKWANDYTGTKNLPLAYLYAIGKQIDSRVSHRILSEACGLSMIGGISPIPQFLYGSGTLSERNIRQIGNFFANLISQKGMPPTELLWNRLLSETEDKLIKHRYVNYLLYACIAHFERSSCLVSHPEKPMVGIGNGLVDYCIKVLKKDISSGVADSQFSFQVKYKGKCYIILVISAYDSSHKHKEYPGRWRASLLSFDDQGFKWGPVSQECIVILDGVWTELYGDVRKALRAFILPGMKGVYDTNSFFAKPADHILA